MGNVRQQQPDTTLEHAMTRTNSVDLLLDERSRLVAQKGAAEGNLWSAEFLLHRVAKLLPHLIADSPYNAVARDTIAEEIRELLSENRAHPGSSALPDASEVSVTDLVGDVGQSGTTSADDEPSS